MTTISGFNTLDIRFPTTAELDGSNVPEELRTPPQRAEELIP